MFPLIKRISRIQQYTYGVFVGTTKLTNKALVESSTKCSCSNFQFKDYYMKVTEMLEFIFKVRWVYINSLSLKFYNNNFYLKHSIFTPVYVCNLPTITGEVFV